MKKQEDKNTLKNRQEILEEKQLKSIEKIYSRVF